MLKFHKVLSIFILCFILVTLLIFSSCGKLESHRTNKTLRICAPTWVLGKYKLQDAADKFMKENPGLKVEIDQYSNFDSSYYPLVNKSNQNKYDLIIGQSREHIVQFASSGALMEFGDNFFNEDLKNEDFFPSFLELGNINGKQFMIPLVGEVMAIVVRKDLFIKNGLSDANGMPIPPKDWDQLHQYAKKLTTVDNKNHKVYGINIDLGINMLLYSFYSSLQAKQGGIFDIKSLYVDTSSSNVKYILGKWQKLVHEGLCPTYTFDNLDAGRENFKAGNVAMLLSPHSRWVESAAALGQENVGIIPLPGAENNGSLTYIHGITIPSSSQNKELAISFIKQKLLSRDFQAWSMKNFGKIPSLIRNYDVNLSPEWKSIFSWVRNATTLPLYKDWSKFDKFFQLEVQNCVIGKQSVDQTTTNITKELNKLDKSTGLGL